MSPLGLPTVTLPAPDAVDLTKTYDVLVVGSGAAGGMAAHVLTGHGLDVLMLEAGVQVDFEEEVRSTEWPYHHPRRGKLPPDTYVLNELDYKRLKPPYAQNLGRYTNVVSWQQLGEGPDYTKKFFVNEKDHPYTGTNFSWVRSRALGGKTNVWGRLALRLSDYDFKAASRDGYGDDWPISYADVSPYYDKVDRYLGISGVTENLPWLPELDLPAPDQAQPGRSAHARRARRQEGLGGHAVPARRHHRGIGAQQISFALLRPWRLLPAGRRLRHPCGINSPTGLIYPAWDTGHLAVRTNATVHKVLMDANTGKAKGVAFLDTATRKSYEAKAKVVVLAASTLESTRIMLLSKSRQHPNGLANYSGHLGRNVGAGAPDDPPRLRRMGRLASPRGVPGHRGHADPAGRHPARPGLRRAEADVAVGQ